MYRSVLPTVAFLACLAPAVASARGLASSVDDPFEKFNRQSFGLSIELDKLVVGPLARVSAGLTPAPLEKAIHNILVNLSEPVVILNNLLQGRPQGAIKATTRFLVNSTIGLAGALDVAAGTGLRHEANGFGDTLGRYGMGPGPYLFIPLLGPSDLRDGIGRGVDAVSTPLFYLRFPYRTPIELGLGVVGGLDERAQAGPELHALLDGAADPYATLRSTYLQSREAEIRGQSALPSLPDIEGPSEASPLANTAGAPSGDPAADGGLKPPPPLSGAAPSAPSPGPLQDPAMPSEPAPQSPDPGLF